MSLNFNVDPYYDDFDQTKNFHRILFKPGRAVQARELTQIQSMVQKQIDLFGRHVFKEGSIVIPGEFIIDLKSPYVKVKDLDSVSAEVTIAEFKDYDISSSINGVTGGVAVMFSFVGHAMLSDQLARHV